MTLGVSEMQVSGARRALLVAGGASPVLAALPRLAWGRQLEEPLVDSVRSALSAAIASHAPPVPVHAEPNVNANYLQWMERTSERMRPKVPNPLERTELLQTIWYESRRAGLEVSTVLGLIQVESNFRKYAISPVGARGLMQVMPFWTRVIGDGDASRLFHLQTNLRFGCVILRHYLDIEKGNYYYALGRYNGSRGQPQYPAAVLGAKQRWAT
jgi:soluble lytic murein transglycosylase-like protein